MKTLFIRTAVLAAFLTAMALGSASAAADEVKVRIDNFAFTPTTLTVAAGTKLHWVNGDDVPHIVIGVDQDTPIKSPPLDTDDEYVVVLDKPGTYKYFCSLHPHMVGTVVVK